MNVFLTCRSWYVESSKILFEMVTPVFTSTADAYRFFVTPPRRDTRRLQHLRHLELNITQRDDRVYLRYARFARSVDPHLRGVPFGDRIWRKLIDEIRVRAPALRDLDVNIGWKIYPEVILHPFGEMAGIFDPETGGEGLVRVASTRNDIFESLRRQASRFKPSPHEWVLPGKVVVQFWPRNKGSKAVVYVQEGKEMKLKQI